MEKDHNPKLLSEEEAKIYDRQIRLWGVDGQHRIRECRVLLVGLKGVNAEICKNLVLAGVNSVTILEHEKITEEDLASHLFLSKEHIGKNRATCSYQRISDLNPLVKVTCDEENVDDKKDDFFSQFRIIVATNCNLNTLIRLNKISRKNNTYFFAADNMGFFGYFFVDLNLWVYKKKLAQDQEHKSKKIKTDSHEESIQLSYPSLEEALETPFDKIKRSPRLYFGMKLLWQFQQEKGAMVRNETTKKQFLDYCTEKTQNSGIAALQATFFEELYNSLSCEMMPVCAILGGILTQEIMKAIFETEEPVRNFFFYDGKNLRQPGNTARVPPSS